MGLLEALGAAPPHRSAKEADASDPKVVDGDGRAQDRFDDAMQTASSKETKPHAARQDVKTETKIAEAGLDSLLLQEMAANEDKHIIIIRDAGAPNKSNVKITLPSGERSEPAEKEVRTAKSEGPSRKVDQDTSGLVVAAPPAIALSSLEAAAHLAGEPLATPQDISVSLSSKITAREHVANLTHSAYRASLLKPDPAKQNETGDPKVAKEDHAADLQPDDIIKSSTPTPAHAKLGISPPVQQTKEKIDISQATVTALKDPRAAAPQLEPMLQEQQAAQDPPKLASVAAVLDPKKDKIEQTPARAQPSSLSPASPNHLAHTQDAPNQTAQVTRLEVRQSIHADSPDIARQVIAAVRTDAGGDRIEVRLDPPDLGRVRIHFTLHHGDSVTAVVSSDRNDTLDAMRRHAGDLAKELSRAGFVNVQLEFKSGGDRAFAAATQKPSLSGVIPEEGVTEQPNFVYVRARIDGRLDRLV